LKMASPAFNNTNADTIKPIITTNTTDSIFLSKKYKTADKNNSAAATNRIIDIGLMRAVITAGKNVSLIIYYLCRYSFETFSNT
ncbi:MAG: hypothetical protein KGL19_04590, partial [Bacteroidota bacterium]|nr:hypothetical protein [Bacteroidota bacterium]